MEATHASIEVVWLQRLCSEIGFKQYVIRIDCESQSEIFPVKNPAYHSKINHIDVQYHFVRDMVESKKVLLEKVETLDNVADSLTKSVSTENLSWCREIMGTYALYFSYGKVCFSLYAKKARSGRMLGICYILCMELEPKLD